MFDKDYFRMFNENKEDTIPQHLHRNPKNGTYEVHLSKEGHSNLQYIGDLREILEQNKNLIETNEQLMFQFLQSGLS